MILDLALDRLVMFWGPSPMFFPLAILVCFLYSKRRLVWVLCGCLLVLWTVWIVARDWRSNMLLSSAALAGLSCAGGLAMARWKLGGMPPKRVLSLAFPVVLPTLVDCVYFPANVLFVVQVLGCDCDTDGLNANHITLGVFAAAFLLSLLAALKCSKGMQAGRRIAYCGVSCAASAWSCCYILIWSTWL